MNSILITDSDNFVKIYVDTAISEAFPFLARRVSHFHLLFLLNLAALRQSSILQEHDLDGALFIRKLLINRRDENVQLIIGIIDMFV